MVRVSINPTKELSLSELRLILLSALHATKTNTPLIIRMEDGDRANYIEGKDQELLEMLELFGIGYSHLYYQSENFKYHLQFASTFLDKKKAFICFCQDATEPYNGACEYLKGDEVLDNPNPFVIRMKKPEHAELIRDALKGELSFAPDTLDNFVIMGQNKYPTAVFASACDDMLQGVTTLIRSNEWLLDAPREAFIRKTIGYDQALNYAHIAPLMDANISVKSLLDEGFLPEAISNYLLSLGTTPPSELFLVHEALTWFDLTAFSSKPSTFDKETLRHFNKEHIVRLDTMELSKRLGYACDNIGQLAKSYMEHFSTTSELKTTIDAIFAKKEAMPEQMRLQELIVKAPYFEAFDAFKAYLGEQSQLDEATLMKELCFWLTGSNAPTNLATIYPFIKTYLKEIVR